MSKVHLHSDSLPVGGPHRVVPLVEFLRLIARAEVMGLVESSEEPHDVRERTLETIRALEAAGIGRARAAMLQLQDLDSQDELTLAAVEALNADLEACPSPRGEWPNLHSLLGIDLLSNLVGVSEASVRRYQRSERVTPDDVAVRLHSVALIVADLAGGYNEFGIRRWFQRKRTALDGRSPQELLRGDWDPGDPGPDQVRHLAAQLVSGGAT